MSISAHPARFSGAAILAAGATALFAAVPASAQVDASAAVNVLVECAKIDDPTARLACYDNNITRVGGAVRSTVPGQVRAQGRGAPIETTGPAGFGFESVRTPQRFNPRVGQLEQITSKITAVSSREPGIYLVTLENGAQWVFAEGIDSGARPPQRGDNVEIERGALGSFLMQIDRAQPIPVRRVR